MRHVNAGGECRRLAPVVGRTPTLPGRKAPCHAVGAEEASPNRRMNKAGRLDAEAVKTQVRPLQPDRLEYRDDGAWIALSLADRADADPHAGFEPVPVLVEVIDIVDGIVALEHRHDRRWDAAGDQRVVSLDGQALVVPDRETCFRQHPGLAHIVLRNGRADAHDPPVMQPAQLRSIVFHGRPVAAVHGKLGKGPAIEKDFRAVYRLLAPTQTVDADAGAVEMAGIARLVQTDIKSKRVTARKRRRRCWCPSCSTDGGAHYVHAACALLVLAARNSA
nr:hypothetical protein SHINE37_60151 [Rhizobiaceae bacterium]